MLAAILALLQEGHTAASETAEHAGAAGEHAAEPWLVEQVNHILGPVVLSLERVVMPPIYGWLLDRGKSTGLYLVLAWIGVGVEYCSSLSARVMGSARPSSRKAVNAESFMWRNRPTPKGIGRGSRGSRTPRVVWAVNEFGDEETGRKPRRGIRSRDPWMAPTDQSVYRHQR